MVRNESTIESYRKEVEQAKAELASANEAFAVCVEPDKLNDQSMDGLDFDDVVYVIDENDKVCPQKLKYKKFGKDGLVEIETPAYYIRKNDETPKCLEAIYIFSEDNDETRYDAFVSKEDADNYLLDERYRHFKGKVDDWTKKLNRVEASLANALARKADLEQVLKDEEAKS